VLCWGILESLYVKWPALPEIDEESPEFDEWAEEYFHQEESTHQSNSLGFPQGRYGRNSK
jgi:hypothetical protein